MAHVVDPPALYMKDRAKKLADQRVVWLKDLEATSRAHTSEASRRKQSAAFLSSVAQHEAYPPLKAAFTLYSAACHGTGTLLESLNSEHVDKKVTAALAAYEGAW